MGIAFGLGDEIRGSLMQILINVSGMALAGWLTLAFQHHVWHRVAERRARLLRFGRASESSESINPL